MKVLGVDPGGTFTGVVLRHGDDVLYATCVARQSGEPHDAYVRRVLNACHFATARCYMYRLDLVCVEDVNPPVPQMGMTSVGGLLGCAVVLGAVVGWTRRGLRLVVVPPGGHGSAPAAAYPGVLRGRRPGRFPGEGPRKHEQSAWDVAGVGRTLHRQRSAA